MARKSSVSSATDFLDLHVVYTELVLLQTQLRQLTVFVRPFLQASYSSACQVLVLWVVGQRSTVCVHTQIWLCGDCCLNVQVLLQDRFSLDTGIKHVNIIVRVAFLCLGATLLVLVNPVAVAFLLQFLVHFSAFALGELGKTLGSYWLWVLLGFWFSFHKCRAFLKLRLFGFLGCERQICSRPFEGGMTWCHLWQGNFSARKPWSKKGRRQNFLRWNFSRALVFREFQEKADKQVLLWTCLFFFNGKRFKFMSYRNSLWTFDPWELETNSEKVSYRKITQNNGMFWIGKLLSFSINIFICSQVF